MSAQRDIQKFANTLLGSVWAEVQLERAKADPKGLYFPKGNNYRYFSIKTGKPRTMRGVRFTPQIRFCRSVHPNHTGLYVAWVDDILANGKVKRHSFTFNKSKKLIMEHSREEYERARKAKAVEA